MEKNFNKLTTDSENLIKEFALLSNGAIVKFHSREDVIIHKIGSRTLSGTKFTEGRLVTSAVPNGLAFTTFVAENASIMGGGTLLHSSEDVRNFENEAEISDK